jgi:hypothetical protein
LMTVLSCIHCCCTTAAIVRILVSHVSASLYLLLLLFARTLWNALSQMPASFHFRGISSISSLFSSTAMWNSSQGSQELEVSGS